MRYAFAGLAVSAVLLIASPALAEQSPLLGRWAVDVTQLPVPAETRPRSVTFTFSDVGEGNWKAEVDIVAADGAATHSEGTGPLDGTPAPVTNSIEADTVAVSTPAPDVMIMALSNKGVPSSMRVFTVAPDGNSLVETAVYYSREGVPSMRRAYFTRLR